MAERPAFQQKQFAFAAHIRDPEHVATPEGVEERRMAVYRKLFFNNLLNLLSTMFPVLKKLIPDDRWRAMIRQFMQHHRASTPYFLQLPEEFLGFLQNEYQLQDDDYPFLLELAHYEYIELALSISEESNDMQGVDPDADLLANVPVKSNLTWVYAYSYPVHRISSEFVPSEQAEQPVFLAVYRGSGDEVGFLELNPVTAGLLELIGQNESQQTGEALLRQLAAQINYPDVEALLERRSEFPVFSSLRVPLCHARAAPRHRDN